MTGRPSEYTSELADMICDNLSKGVPLAVICRNEVMPSRQTVYNWMKVDEELSLRIARAREDGEEQIAANLRDIARGKGESTSDVQRDKLIIDTDLKLLAKWNPKKYGDRTTLAGDPEAPLHVQQITRRIVDPKNES